MRRIRRWWRELPDLLALREIAIVVVGILIAFALEAWWDQRTTAARERAHLRALASDFRENVQRLAHAIEEEEQISTSSRELLLLARRGEPAPPDSVRRLLSDVFLSIRFDPVMGAYEALENSAELALLRDDSLRAALADFADQADVSYIEELSTELYVSLIREFVGEASLFAPSVANDDAVPPDAVPLDLLANPKFQEYLAIRHLTERDVAGAYRRLAEQAEAILARLQPRSK